MAAFLTLQGTKTAQIAAWPRLCEGAAFVVLTPISLNSPQVRPRRLAFRHQAMAANTCPEPHCCLGSKF